MPTKRTVWKAQWPLGGTAERMILIYEADAPFKTRKEFYLPATEDHHQSLFDGKYIRVFFEGTVTRNECRVDKFVREGEWL